MDQRTYVGSNEDLKGKTALVRDDPVTCAGGNFGMVLAQFDDLELTANIDGSGIRTLMAFGWNLFERKEFN